MSQDRPDYSAFTAWLRARVAADGRAVSALNRSAGVGKETINRFLAPAGSRPMERTVRKLAVFFGADPDEIAALAGYADRRVPAPDPREFGTIRKWLAAALEARRESQWQAAKGAGLSELGCYGILNQGRVPDPRTVVALADYFGVDRRALLELRGRKRGRDARPPARSAFTDLLAQRVYSSGAHPAEIARAAGIGANTLTRVLWRPDWRLREDQVRRLAAHFGESPDEWAALAGYADVRATIPQPQEFGALRDWIEATLAARHESPHVAALRAGISKPTLHSLLTGKIARLSKRTIRKAAAYFGVDLIELLRLLAKAPPRRRRRDTAEHITRSGAILRVGRAIRALNRSGVDPAFRAKELPRAQAALAELRRDARPIFKKRTTGSSGRIRRRPGVVRRRG